MRRSRWVPAALWAALIELLTSWPTPSGMSVPAGSDKVAHAALYAVFGFLVARAVQTGRPGLRVTLAVLPALAAWAALDEWHQRFIAGRTPSTADWVADICGVAIGMAARRAKPTGLSAGPA